MGVSGNPNGRPPSERAFANALRVAVTQTAKDGQPRLRKIAEKAVEQALAGQSWAIQFIADRLDGKPVQESVNTHEFKRDATDWTRDELVALIHDALARSPAPAAEDDSGRPSDPIH